MSQAAPWSLPRATRPSLLIAREMIQDFGEMVKTHLRRFQQHEKVLPAKIIVFRDGVSEGQWAQSVQ